VARGRDLWELTAGERKHSQQLFKRKRDKQTVPERQGGNVNFQRGGRTRKE